MTFTSYAQNFEDLLLWRALRQVEEGYYVDIGAAWPEEHSVTRAFYERGWSGINVEPNPRFHELLVRDRPRDTNLPLAVSDRAGRLPMTFFGDTGLSTLDAGVAARHVASGRGCEVRDVEITTLAALWEEHVPSGQAVHFLKVDVEGLETAVLRGQDWSRNRPWIVVVEATLPLSQEESFHSWEPILLEAQYLFAWADGLNRFYAAVERSAALLPAFQYPPNCFDDFIPVGQRRAEEGLVLAEKRAAEEKERADSAEERADRERRLAAEAVERAISADLRAREAVATASGAVTLAAEAESRAAIAEARARDAWTRMAGAEARLRDAEARAAEAGRRAQEALRLEAERARALTEIERSFAWRLTRPFSGLFGRGRRTD